MSMLQISWFSVLAPLFGAVIAGLGGRIIGRVGAHSVTILGVFFHKKRPLNRGLKGGAIMLIRKHNVDFYTNSTFSSLSKSK